MKCSLCLPNDVCQLPLPSASTLLGYGSIARPVHYPLKVHHLHNKDSLKKESRAEVMWVSSRPLSDKERLEQSPHRIRKIYENCLCIANTNSSSDPNGPSKEEIIDTFSYILRINPFAVRDVVGARLQASYFKEGEVLCTYRTLLPLTYEDRLAKQEGTYVSLAERALQLYPNDREIALLAHRIFRERAPQFDANGNLVKDTRGFPLLPEWMTEKLTSYDPRKDPSLSARRA